MPKCYMMVGLPYSGKSHFIKNTPVLTQNDNIVVISADKYIHKMAEALGKSYLEVFPHVYQAANVFAQKELEDASIYGFDIVIDQTNINRFSRENKLGLLLSDYEKIAVVMPEISQDELTNRIASRENQYIPSGIMATMRDLYTEPTLNEGFDQIVHVGFDDVVIGEETFYEG